MLYLEDYLEMIENLPMEMRDKFTEMREMDLQVSNSTDSIEDRVSDFFKVCASGSVKPEWKDDQLAKIKLEYSRALEDADEKVQLANQIYELVERHLRKLDQEVLKFKMELEADNAGITEVLEKRLSEPDHPPPQHNIYSRPEKRKYSSISTSYNKHLTTTVHHNYPSTTNNNHTYPLSIHNNTASKNNATNNNITINNNNNGPHNNSNFNRISSSSSLAAELSRDNSNNNNIPSFTRALNSNNLQQQQQQQHTQHNNNIHQGTVANLTYEHHHQSQPKIIGCNLGSGSNAAIAVAASRAIGATVEMQQGRRTSSLKASYEAYKKISKVLPIDKELPGSSSSSSSTHLPHENKITIRPNKRLVTLDKYAPTLKIKMTTNNSSTALSNQQQGARSAYHLQHQQPSMEQIGLTPVDTLVPGETELTASGWHADPNEPRYCICNDVSYGDMVGCDNEDCPLEWFHYGCVGLQQAPRGKWYCPQCTSAMKRRGRK